MQCRKVLVLALFSYLGFSIPAFGQGDLALHGTFSRYAPAVYSIKVEIPKDYFLKRYEQSILELKEYQDSFADFVENATEVDVNFSIFENFIAGFEQQIIQLQKQSRRGHYIKGAGFAIAPHYMVTMSTIIKSATLGGEISIINNESNQYKAEIKGIDELTGIAVLQVKNATFTRYVDLKSINPSLPEASMVLSIQRPYNLPASPEPGMIGGFNRAMGIFDLEKYIQSNLRLYPGNEGAPVFGPAGQLVGMIAKEYRQGEWPGITFIIPADMIIDSALSIIETGERERGWIPGLVLRQEQNGIMIEHIEEGSPAIKAGLMKGDMIVGINGAKENNMYDFRNQLLSTKPHEPVNLLIQRGTRQTWVQVKTTPVKLIPITKTTP